MNYRIDFGRIYDTEARAKTARVLVDRLWPRGKRKAELGDIEWLRDVAPSPALRRAWHAGEISRSVFSRKYRKELDAEPDVLLPLMRHARRGALVLLTASREPEQSHLPILREAVLDALAREDWEADGREPSSPVCYRKDDD